MEVNSKKIFVGKDSAAGAYTQAKGVGPDFLNGSWSELPLEILARVLSFLPPCGLGRCRVVCKRWNTFIGPTARNLHDMERKDAKQKTYALATPNAFKTSCVVPQNWTLMDIDSGMWYNLQDKFLERLEGMQGFRDRRTLATGGSLICVLYTGSVSGEDNAMVVCNPVAETMKKLPPLRLYSCYGKLNPAVFMVVTDDDYKIFVVNDFSKKEPALPRLHVYESSTQQWRCLCNPPADCKSLSSSIMYQGLLYTLFTLGGEMGHLLVTYNVREEEWNEVGVRLPGNLQVPQLVESFGRLCMVAGRDKSRQGKRRLEIHELKVAAANKLCETVAVMPSRMLVELWAEDGGPWSDVNCDIGFNAKIVAVGWEESIFVMKSPEDLMFYSLESRYWDHAEWCYEWGAPWPPHRGLVNSQSGWYGNYMSIGLSTLL